MVFTGLLVPLRGRSWPWLGARDAAALRQLYYFFTRRRLDLEHLSPAGVAGGEAPPAPGRTRLAVHPGAHVSPLFSGASGGQDRHGRPEQRGRIAPIMTEAGMARPCPGAGVARVLRDEVPVLIAGLRRPSRTTRRRRRNSGRVAS